MAVQLNQYYLKKFLALLSIVIVLASCGDGKTETNSKKKEGLNSKATSKAKAIQKAVRPEFNPDSSFAFIQRQVLFGPRVNNSKAHRECLKYLVSSFEKYECTVQLQSGSITAHDGKKLEFSNVIAALNPNANMRLMISAHWDSRPWADNDQDESYWEKPIDAANDGASGVAVILELARTLSLDSNFINSDIGIDFILFDAEDYGISNIPKSFCYGSQYWQKSPLFIGERPIYGINLDMVGGKNAHFYYEGFSNEYARHVLDKVWGVAANLGYSDMFHREMSYPITDDHLYVNYAGIPCIDIIHRDPTTGSFVNTWHTHDDRIDEISKETLKAVGQVLVELVYKELGI